MGLLVPGRRVYRGWRKVLPLYDGRECPDCGAVILGRQGRRLHREWHMAERAWKEWAEVTIMQVARKAGLRVEEPAGGEASDEYQLISVGDLELDDDEEDDDE